MKVAGRQVEIYKNLEKSIVQNTKKTLQSQNWYIEISVKKFPPIGQIGSCSWIAKVFSMTY